MIGASVNLVDLDEGLRGMKAKARDFAPVMRAMAELVKEDVAEHFRFQVGHDGPWPPRAASTVARVLGKRDARGRRVNVITRGMRGRQGPLALSRRGARALGRPLLGKLRTTLRWRLGSRYVIGEQIVTWAEIHEFGGVGAKGARIPARPAVFADGSTLAKFGELARRHLVAGWTGRLS